MTDRSSNTASLAQATVIPFPWLRRLWERMTAFYGHAWVNVHGQSAQDEEGALTVAGETWQKALVGLEASQFADGLAACIAEGGEFPPSAPRFRSMCLGVPSLAAVRSHFTAGTTQRNTPFVAKCWEFIDSWSYCQSSRAEADRMLREAYEQARDFVMRGGVLPEVPVALIEAQQPAAPQPASPDVAHAALEEISSMFHHPELAAREEKLMAEFHISRNQAHELIESGVV
ncbi:hypothetical protein D1605_007220 [Xylella fastidiosa subsp. fastidiosa]|uniref:Uncharacterized protein n=1 Tax=Xylella fastidiosa (strain Temecula1 / ATCC 700964) TaxID=183190 RepID=Q87BV2_XYLFT|nr:hypothetical protein [Xylella fastidiosa]ADN62187.1 hypothetical protein XFLM_00835 [Xylella fastidiosa subsp. fastidiosa GB514]KAF0570397.1 hypothetical protein P305_10085 [Xylella fastidiosa subsp. fastidiosa Mus-1]AAO29193.1 conserved hypothetical protein [Xylella fastidiosa Temecula1]ADN64003.1 hypothetical protein XFLM_10685 [Xylella fastidiosa subsp. fastidiosa GB514]KGM20067.1 hypothetical protein JT24_07505 [Xylella fastidiosa]